jgi:hypothetical protein
MRAGGCFLTACAIAGAVLIGGCRSADDGPATSANPSGGDPAEFCRIVADLNGSDPFAELASARTRADADAVVEDGMVRIARLREAAPPRVRGRTERYVQVFEDFERLMHDTGYDPDPRDYAELQTRTTRARLDFTAAAEAVCGAGESGPAPT